MPLLRRCQAGLHKLQASAAAHHPSSSSSSGCTATDTLSDTLDSMAVSPLAAPGRCAHMMMSDTADTLMIETDALDPSFPGSSAPKRMDGRTLRELVCAAEEAAENGLPSPSMTPTGGIRLEPARPVHDLHIAVPRAARPAPSSRDLEEWRALAPQPVYTNPAEDCTESSDDDSCVSPPTTPPLLSGKDDCVDCTPPSVALPGAVASDSENVGKREGRRVRFSTSSPCVQLIPACSGAIRRPARRSHRRWQRSIEASMSSILDASGSGIA